VSSMADTPRDPIRNAQDDSRDTAVFERETASVGEARRWLISFLDRHGVATGLCDDAVLVLSELVTNALRHGLGTVVARVAIEPDGELQISVTDSGRELPVRLEPDLDRVGGVGLQIVDRLTRAWGVSPFPGGKTVWARLATA
jgi:anti-sigma regulatory factor (Ser/Thr protein kinase)